MDGADVSSGDQFDHLQHWHGLFAAKCLHDSVFYFGNFLKIKNNVAITHTHTHTHTTLVHHNWSQKTIVHDQNKIKNKQKTLIIFRHNSRGTLVEDDPQIANFSELIWLWIWQINIWNHNVEMHSDFDSSVTTKGKTTLPAFPKTPLKAR